MKITGFIWLEEIVQKLVWKHSVQIEEVRELFLNQSRFILLKMGKEKAKMYLRRTVNGGRYKC